MGSSGFKRRGRRHLPKVQNGALVPSGFERGAWTWEGTLDRAGAFVRGLSADSRDSRRRLRFQAWGFVAILLLLAAVALLTRFL
jgi:hypothetical protein